MSPADTGSEDNARRRASAFLFVAVTRRHGDFFAEEAEAEKFGAVAPASALIALSFRSFRISL